MKRIFLAAIAVAGLAVAWLAERGSLERANRLYRAGAVQEAVALYEQRFVGESGAALVRYNLGTALLGLHDEKASVLLAAIPGESDESIRIRAHYNLGVGRLTQALSAEDLVSARSNAVSAVAANRSVLRLQPGHADAAWNLSIALRLIASIDAGDQEGVRVLTKGPAAPEQALHPDQKEDTDESMRAAEGETAAGTAEVAPLSPREASRIVGMGHRDPTRMVAKLMAREGRARRAREAGREGR